MSRARASLGSRSAQATCNQLVNLWREALGQDTSERGHFTPHILMTGHKRRHVP